MRSFVNYDTASQGKRLLDDLKRLLDKLYFHARKPARMLLRARINLAPTSDTVIFMKICVTGYK
jgi:hypothetical protein